MNRKQLVINVADVNNYNLFNNLGANYSPGFTDIIVNVSGNIGSTNTSTPSFTTGTGYKIGDTIKLVNDGYIWGRGGAGGAGGSATSQTPVFSGYTTSGGAGGVGGSGLELLFNTTIVNNGQIASGGNGGKGGDSMCSVSLNNGNPASPSWYSVGGVGGNGAGWPVYGAAPSAGAAATGYSSQASSNGGSGSPLGSSSGHCVKGNAFATWLVTGSRLGTISQ